MNALMHSSNKLIYRGLLKELVSQIMSVIHARITDIKLREMIQRIQRAIMNVEFQCH